MVHLAPSAAGGTDLSYDADAAVGGMIGGVGQRMLSGVTRKMAGQFFEAVDDDIAGVRKEKKTRPRRGAARAAPDRGGGHVHGGRRRPAVLPGVSPPAGPSRSPGLSWDG